MHGLTITIRVAKGRDAPAVERLAALESQPVPDGRLVIAERDGELVAAMPLAGGELLADPFHRTAEIGELLGLWARRLREEERERATGAGPHAPERSRGRARAPVPASTGRGASARPGARAR
jgi:hypothetical protein